VLFSALKEGRELPPQEEEERIVKKVTTTIKKVQQNAGKTNMNEGGN